MFVKVVGRVSNIKESTVNDSIPVINFKLSEEMPSDRPEHKRNVFSCSCYGAKATQMKDTLGDNMLVVIDGELMGNTSITIHMFETLSGVKNNKFGGNRDEE